MENIEQNLKIYLQRENRNEEISDDYLQKKNRYTYLEIKNLNK